MSVELKSGRKIVKSVSTVAEANSLIRELVAIRNNDSMWEIDESGTMKAWSAMDKAFGTSVDVFAAMSVWMNGKKARTLWAKGF